MDLSGKTTLGSCWLYGCLAHLTNFGSYLSFTLCVLHVLCVPGCQGFSISLLQTGALCTTKERLSFLHECTKYLALEILRFSQKNLNHVHDHHFSFEHQANAELQVWLEAERSGDSFLTHNLCCEHCCLLVRGALLCCHQTVLDLYLLGVLNRRQSVNSPPHPKLEAMAVCSR